MSALTHGLRERYEADGYVRESIDLADPSVLSSLLRDQSLFSESVAKLALEGRKQVPYQFTEAIERVAADAALSNAVTTILGTDQWVAWGPNIRVDTPNAAHRWHVDLESFLWPSTITVAVGIDGCRPEGATWFLPGTHSLTSAPGDRAAASDDLAAARATQLSGRTPKPDQVTDFGDGRFYLFNAKCWHRGDPSTSAGRVVLFLHYQRAREPRIPFMLDYTSHRWSRQAAPYIASATCNRVETTVHRPPLKSRLRGLVRGFLGS